MKLKIQKKKFKIKRKTMCGKKTKNYTKIKI